MCLHQTGLSPDISILTSDRGRSDIYIQNDSLRERQESEERHGGRYKNIFSASVTLPTTYNSAVLGQRNCPCINITQALSFSYQFQSLLYCLASISLDTSHCTSSFISRLFSNLVSPVGDSFFLSLHLSTFLSLAFNLTLCQSPHVSHLSILYCYCATYFWGHFISNAVINSSHLDLLASLVSVSLTLCLSSALSIQPSSWALTLSSFLFFTLTSQLLSLRSYSNLSLGAKTKIHAATGMY